MREDLPTLAAFYISHLVTAYRLRKKVKTGVPLFLVFYKVIAEPFEVELQGEHEGYLWMTKDQLPSLLNAEYSIESGDCNAFIKAFD